ncbi:formylglycine-generating enzyme family protein [Limnoraphis robusta]|uniref:Formylglycine-generating enzyme family protein n=1 Tax=Limnoraphis robusta CCNP1315 TaxID=3110306 RepID=A0ABU5TYG7_9CYAN|nr:formylglycine-generating enzyme family protein [Limnoraphis robusta]MEA5495971.1 formylglycine-generating enzyme family protein [Limnoraphis robusta BA-68 BA1]MEA5519999.1 formylglycine-generating enzyme family protein [Limnoraphis robusta CCNP1315]MEA5544895.1 formylglycine-generating enzyme family protein [Limnoraphis robusta CCNP1324]
METSKQQRRSTIGQFAQQLKRSGLELDAADLADLLWLAQFIESESEGSSEEISEESLTSSSTQTNTIDDIIDERNISISEPTFNLYSNEESSSISQTTESFEPSQTDQKALPFPVPSAPAIRTSLDLARALRPLMRKVPSRILVDVDEEATVNQLAETRICVPVIRPTPERWLDLDLVVECSKTTVLWKRAIAELQHLMEYQGAFRTARTWRLQAEEQTVQLFPRWNERLENRLTQRPRSIRELVDPSGRRLILYVSDCTSALWRQGVIYETLWQWSQTQQLALMQMLPERLWSRTALSDGYIVRLGGRVAGLPNARLDVEGLPELDGWDEWDEPEEVSDSRLLTLPIVTLDPNSFQRWARVLAGVGECRTPGRVFELAFVGEMADEPVSTPVRTAKQRVELFRATASRTARQLAGLMAAIPVSLPVIDLLRDEFLPDAQQDHVAEVLLSGLLRRCDADESEVCQYEFFEGVRDLLIDGVPIGKTTAILDRLSEIIAQKAGRTINSFEALLTVLEESENALGESALPFASVGVDVLRRLGGNYQELAERYGRRELSSVVETATQTVDFLLEEREYEVAKVVNFPPLQTFEYEFETATISRENEEWVVHRSRSSACGYTELLNDEIGLEMVLIPGGTFVMGAPEDEPESRENERPQHEVTIQPFFLGLYTVTQAQWRIVASYPQIERELNPNPSQFKGDNRPVENVSWEDATEFCRRLSTKTGREYKLPSEAQWEYACRAGTKTPFHFGETITTDLANYRGTDDDQDSQLSGSYGRENKGKYRKQTTDVGSFPPNNFGLHDMHGNVWEWCEDDYHMNYEGAPTDGSVWIEDDGSIWTDKYRRDPGWVLRGGSWDSYPWKCRSAHRSFSHRRNDRDDFIGFRVVCVMPSM